MAHGLRTQPKPYCFRAEIPKRPYRYYLSMGIVELLRWKLSGPMRLADVIV